MYKLRNEWKFLYSERQLKQLEMRLDSVLNLDKYCASTGNYTIHSLYFDDIKNSCANDTEIGSPIRFKYRIRYYNDDLSTLHIERKEKTNGKCQKLSCPLSPEQYALIRDNDIDLLYKEADNKLMERFCADILSYGFAPKAIIDYQRTAYIEPLTNIRITLDRDICASAQVDLFTTKDYISFPLQQLNHQILEVKFDDILPSYIKRIIQSPEMQQITFSKYYIGLNILSRK